VTMLYAWVAVGIPAPHALASMVIPVVEIVEGTETPVGVGVNAAVRAIVRYPDATIRAGIVKAMAPASVAAEVFCALVLRGWGLSVPDAAIVASPFAFVSIDVGYPNLKQRIGFVSGLPPAVQLALESWGAKLVSEFAETPLALAADEAIENRDRNFGNILWDGSNVAWIDHERALGVVTQPDQNKLAQMTVVAGNHDQVQRAAVALALTLVPQVVATASAECGHLPETAQFVANVSARLSHLANLVLARFPQPPGLFNAPGVEA